jgi:hypothetical protein
VVVDEPHMVGDEDRGYLLELMLNQLRRVTAHIVCLAFVSSGCGWHMVGDEDRGYLLQLMPNKLG